MKRSRIEGTLHRSLPATISIRAAEGTQSDDGLLRLRLSVSSETPYLRSSWWDDPWIEVLGHKDGEIDLSRLNNGAAVLANHDRYTSHGNTPLAGIGAVERAWIEGSRLMADIVISRRDALADLRQDIQDGLVRNVSIGYIINERVLVKANADGQPDEYRVTSWTPFEVSPVDIPADASVGLGRSADGTTPPNATPGYRVVDLPPAVGNNLETRAMTQTATPPATPPAGETQEQQRAHAQPRQPAPADLLTQERERVREISALGKQLGVAELAERAVEAGTSLDAFRAQVIQAQVDAGQLRQAESAEIGMSSRDIKEYSFLRALLAAADPAHAAAIAPHEMACSRAAQDKRSDSRDKTREAAITIPVDVLNRGIALNEVAAASAATMLIQRAQRGAAAAAHFRDLVVGTASAGGNTVANELMGSSFIELLRNALVLDRMGITMLRDLNGNIAIPSQTGTATTYWIAENTNITAESQQAFGQVTLSPKTIGAYTDYSRRLLLQSSIDIEAFVRADLAAVIAQGILAAAIAGTGSGNQPTGVLNTSGIGSVPMGANGGAPTYDMAVDLETAIAVANADVGNMSFLANAKVRGKLRKTQVFTGTNGAPVWTSGRERGIGEVLGYDAYVTNAMPSNLDKGTSTGVCSATVFANWADLLLGMWGGLDVMLDPYTGGLAGTRRVIALQDLDVALRRVSSFAATKDILTT